MLLDILVVNKDGKVVFYKSFTDEESLVRIKHLKKITALIDTLRNFGSDAFPLKVDMIELGNYKFAIKKHEGFTYLIVSTVESYYPAERIVELLHPLIKSGEIKKLKRIDLSNLIEKLNEILIPFQAYMMEIKRALNGWNDRSIGVFDALIKVVPEINFDVGISLSDLPKIEVNDIGDVIEKYFSTDVFETIYKLNYLLNRTSDDAVRALFVYTALKAKEFEDQKYIIKFSEIVNQSMKIRNPVIRNYIESLIMAYTSFNGMEREYHKRVELSNYVKNHINKLKKDLFTYAFITILSIGEEEVLIDDDIVGIYCELCKRIDRVKKMYESMKSYNLDKIIDIYSESVDIFYKSFIAKNNQLTFLILDLLTNFLLGLAELKDAEEVVADLLHNFQINIVQKKLLELVEIRNIPISIKYRSLSKLLMLSLYYNLVINRGSYQSISNLLEATINIFEMYNKALGYAAQKPLHYYEITTNYMALLELIRLYLNIKELYFSPELIEKMLREDFIIVSKPYKNEVLGIINNLLVVGIAETKNKNLYDFFKAKMMEEVNMLNPVSPINGKIRLTKRLLEEVFENNKSKLQV